MIVPSGFTIASTVVGLAVYPGICGTATLIVSPVLPVAVTFLSPWTVGIVTSVVTVFGVYLTA